MLISRTERHAELHGWCAQALVETHRGPCYALNVAPEGPAAPVGRRPERQQVTMWCIDNLGATFGVCLDSEAAPTGVCITLAQMPRTCFT